MCTCKKQTVAKNETETVHSAVMEMKEDFHICHLGNRGNEGSSPQFLHPDSNSTFCSITLDTKELSGQYSARVHTDVQCLCEV